MTQMTELATFVRARIDEDEAAARDCATVYPPPWDVIDRGWVATVKADGPRYPEVVRHEDQSHGGWLGDHVQHVARWDPARVLAECTAKRQLVELITTEIAQTVERVNEEWGASVADEETALALMALPYADHPDYRSDWAP